MDRVTEPELMVDDDQAVAYSDADFAESHQAAVARFGEAFPSFSRGRVLDLACGPADVTVRFALAYPEARVVGLEGSPPMLALAGQRVAAAGLEQRVGFAHMVLPDPDLAQLGTFDAVVSTNSLHHFHDPSVLWAAMQATARSGACLFVQDLYRPDSPERAQAIVDEYAGGEPEVLRRDFFNSLLAAFTPAEVEAQLTAAGLDGFTVRTVTDRHLVAFGTAP
jgi:SAM-dependent methyltransferase